MNGMLTSHTVEATEIMLPAGEYRVKLVTVNAHRREIRILNKTQVLWSGKNLPGYTPLQWKDPLEHRRSITDSKGLTVELRKRKS